ncbi:MAG: hypothetical protein ACRCZ0_00185 [Cetobacterium sp.]
MIGKILYKRGECTVVDTIHSIRFFEGEEVALNGHLRDYYITKNSAIIETELSEVAVNHITFICLDGTRLTYEKDRKNELLTNEFISCIAL